MSNVSDGMNYAPKGKPQPVVEPGAFKFAAVHLDHGHINGMANGLVEAGATLKWIYDPDPKKVEGLGKARPEAQAAPSLEAVLEDDEVKLVAAAAIPSERGPLGCRVMQAGKDYFTDKTPFTQLDQLEEARRVASDTGRKYMVYYGERLHNEAAMRATELIEEGVIGKVIQVIGLGPHRLSKGSRPDWFFRRAQYGGILCDIGSHQIEQFLTYTGSTDATVTNAAVGNFANPDTPELEDFGEASLVGDSGASNYFRVDWFTPDGLRTWGDGRAFILGTEGYIELRKYIDVAQEPKRMNNLYLVNGEGETRMELSEKVGYKFFGQLVLDCIERTENAMTQAHAFKAAELCLKCQSQAKALTENLR